MNKYLTFWICLQVFIVFLETYIRWSVTGLEPRQRVRGYFCGVCAQFLWLIIFIHTQMWYLMPLLVIDGSIWLRGYFRHKKQLCQQKIKPNPLEWIDN